MLKQFILLVSILLMTSTVEGKNKYEEIDKVSRRIPDSLTTIDEISHFLTDKLEHTDEKVRALHIWITHNIKYDLNQINNVVGYGSYDEMVQETINSRKGICGHYAQLFYHLCKSIGVKSYVISGYTREEGSSQISDLNHAWNAVQIRNDYFFIDNTAAAGYLNDKGEYVHDFSDEYFLISPREFIYTHVPFDPLWQFLNNPITHFEFAAKDFSKLNIEGDFSYKDSIKQINELGKVRQIEKSIQRIKRFGIANKHIREEIRENNELIENQKYSVFVSKYNSINSKVNAFKDDINDAITYSNMFINYMNRGFKKPKVDDETIKSIIENTNTFFYRGKEGLKDCKDKIWSLSYNGNSHIKRKQSEDHKKELLSFITELEFKILEVEPVIQRNTKYSEKYLKTWKPFRFTVLY
ncbi:transglutaminase domain-containing protein [Flagellimonas sp.]|uniref:transglutaminase domain-containing protein n=1 Tax=Flagellimonas sp. TaxID=2058762 RepID=UPI003B593B21